RLSRLHHVAIDFAGFDAVVNRLLPRPSLGVKAGVDDEPAGTKQLRVEPSEPADRIAVVPSVLDGQPLGVETPAFAGRRKSPKQSELPELRLRGVLAVDGELEVMAGNRLVIDERARPELRHVTLPQRNSEHARARAVR